MKRSNLTHAKNVVLKKNKGNSDGLYNNIDQGRLLPKASATASIIEPALEVQPTPLLQPTSAPCVARSEIVADFRSFIKTIPASQRRDAWVWIGMATQEKFPEDLLSSPILIDRRENGVSYWQDYAASSVGREMDKILEQVRDLDFVAAGTAAWHFARRTLRSTIPCEPSEKLTRYLDSEIGFKVQSLARQVRAIDFAVGGLCFWKSAKLELDFLYPKQFLKLMEMEEKELYELRDKLRRQKEAVWEVRALKDEAEKELKEAMEVRR